MRCFDHLRAAENDSSSSTSIQSTCPGGAAEVLSEMVGSEPTPHQPSLCALTEIPCTSMPGPSQRMRKLVVNLSRRLHFGYASSTW
jgi:hypothetical protein